jgi:lipoprotein NlpI
MIRQPFYTVQPLKQRSILFAFLIFIDILPAVCLADMNKTSSENSKAVVAVITSNNTAVAAGIIVRADGAVVTSDSVISNAKDIRVRAGDKDLDVEGVIYADKESGLVILKAKGENLPAARIGDSGKINFGEQVYVISGARGFQKTVLDGTMDGIKYITSHKKVLLVTASMPSTGIGGAVFNKDGDVIGIMTSLSKDQQNVHPAIPLDGIKNEINEKNITALRELSPGESQMTADYWFYLGVANYKRGMYKEEVEAYKQAIQINPDLAEAHYNLGLAYEGLAMHKEAIASFKETIRIKPDFAGGHYNLGIAYVDSGMYGEAIESFRQAVRIRPDYAEAHYNLGIVFIMVHDKDSAFDEYRILKSLDAESAEELFKSIHE